MKALQRTLAGGLACAFLALTLASCGEEDPAVTRLNAAKKAYETALQGQSTATQTLADATFALASDEQEATSIEKSKPTLEEAITKAIKNRDAGERTYQQKQQDTAAARQALAQLEKEQEEPRRYKDNALGFFIWNAHDSGADIETVKKYFLGEVLGSHEAVPNLACATDATSYQNLKESIRWLDKGNEMRRRENTSEGTDLQELLVTDLAMVVAELHADYSKKVIGHHANSGQCAFHMGENLAWGNRSGPDGPFEAWYTNEKKTYQKDPFNKNNDPNWYNSVGHYFNVIDPSYKVAGFAINNDPDCLYGKLYAYSFSLSTRGEKAYTVEQYRARIAAYDAYLRELDTQRNTAQKCVSDAQTSEKAAQSELTRLENAIASAQKARDAAIQRLDDLTEKIAADKAAVTAAQETLEQAKETTRLAKQELEDAQKALEDAHISV